MNLPLPGHHAPNASFEVPLEMLAACHGRVQAQCSTLQRLGPHLASHGADLAAQQAAAAVLRYFDTAALHHHEDEEQDLFPALRAALAGQPQAAAVQQLLQALCDDHLALGRQWVALKQVLVPMASGQAVDWPVAAVRAFIEAYATHIHTEETQLLPLAARVLPAATLDVVGRAMRQRRGLL